MRNFKVGTKTFAVLLMTAFLSVFLVSIVSVAQMLNLSRYSTNANKRLGDKSSESSKQALQEQAGEYIVKIATEQALKVDVVLGYIQGDIWAVSEFITGLYKNESRLTGKPLPLPYETEEGVPSSKSQLAPGVERTPELERELLLISNCEYMVAPIYNSDADADDIYLGTESGISYRFSPYSAYVFDYDPRERNWYKAAMEKPGESVWIDTYVDVYGTVCVTNAITFTDENGKVAGVVATDITLDRIRTDVSSLSIAETGYAVLFDSDGKIIGHPRYGEPGFDVKPLENVIATLPNSKENTLQQITLDGKQHYIALKTLQTVDWQLGIIVSVEEIIAPEIAIKAEIDGYITESQEYMQKAFVTMLIHLIIILVAAAVVILVVSYLISRTITTPITVLLDSVKEIGGGNLDLQINENGKDEIAELAAAFNKMTVDLKEYISTVSHITAEKERIGAELSIASKIQARMIPWIFPAFPDRNEFDIYAAMIPAKEVGGDFYDFYFTDENRLCFVIADVSGKGVPAALFMVVAKTLIKTGALANNSPKVLFESVNDQLCNSENMFVTAFFGIFDIDSGKFTYVNAGHNPPCIMRSGGNFDWLESKHGFVLGGLENMKYQEQEIILNKGDTIFLYTDGVTEATNKENKLFSDAKLISDLNKHKDKNLTELLAAVKTEIDVFSDGAEQSDDITMLGFVVQ